MKTLKIIKHISSEELVLGLFENDKKILEETYVRLVDKKGCFIWDSKHKNILKEIGDRVGFHLIIARLLMGEESVQF